MEWRNSRVQLKKLIESAFDDSAREERVWTPPGVHSYIIHLLTDKAVESPPDDLIEFVRKQHFSIPNEPLERLDHLRSLADSILYWRSYWEIPCPFKLELQAQDYYACAGYIAKKLLEPTDVLFSLAEDLPKYAPVLNKTCRRLVA
jgi:hypothetical protein